MYFPFVGEVRDFKLVSLVVDEYPSPLTSDPRAASVYTVPRPDDLYEEVGYVPIKITLLSNSHPLKIESEGDLHAWFKSSKWVFSGVLRGPIRVRLWYGKVRSLDGL